MSALGSIFSATMLAQTARMSVPYACAALGGVWSEKSGVVNIALEGILLASGLGAVVVHVATGNAWAGVAAAMAVGAAIGALHAVLVLRARVDAIVSGIAINLAAAGGTRFLLRALYASSSNSPGVDGFRAGSSTGGAALLVHTLADPLALFAAALTVASAYVLFRARFGLRTRAAGESPHAATSAGIDVARVRTAAVAIGGAICGVGGCALAYDQHQFQSGMSGGRGFIALAAVILSGWRPVRAAIACVAFAALDALQAVLQDQPWAPREVIQMLPYLATLGALVVVAGGRRGSASLRPPAGLGQSAPI